jgi:hypothetical protein
MGLKSDVFTIKSSALVTAGGSSDAFDVSGYEAGGVLLSITAKTGTFTNYQFFLQSSPDNSTWYGAASGTGLVVGLVAGAAADITAPSAFWLGVNNFIGPWARLTWTIAGGTNVTFAAWGAFRR